MHVSRQREQALADLEFTLRIRDRAATELLTAARENRFLASIAANLAIRTGDLAWLDVNVRVLEGWLPIGYATMPLWQLADALHADGITPAHCILAE